MSDAVGSLVLVLDEAPEHLAAATAELREEPRVVRPLREGFGELTDLAGTTWQQVVVLAGDLGRVRLALPVLHSAGRTRRVSLRLTREPDRKAVSGRSFGQLPLAALGVERLEGGGVRADVRLTSAASVHATVAALVADSPRRMLPRTMSGLRLAAADVGALPWCVGDASARTTGNAAADWWGDETKGSPVDVVVTADPERAPSIGHHVVDVSDRCPPVDLAVVNPSGFTSVADGPVGVLVVTAGPTAPQVRAASEGRDLFLLGADGRLTRADVAAVRELRYLDASSLHHAPARLTAWLLVQLGAAGVPLVTGPLPPHAAALLHPEVVAALESVTTGTLDDAVAREAHSVRVRRAVLRRHRHTSTWSSLREELGRSPLPGPTVSVQLATRRPEFLDHAIGGVAAQQHVDAEVVLVTHGFELPRARVDELTESTPFPLTVLSAPADLVFGEVLNRALYATSGDFLTKMDDDDFYGPHHLEDLVQTLTWSDATVAGAMHQYTYLAALDLTARRRTRSEREVSTRHVPGGTMMIRRDDLVSLGGWRPVESGSIDLALSHGVHESGGRLHLMHGLGFVLCRHGRSHAWVVDHDRFVDNAEEQWSGFHAPPELGDPGRAQAHCAALRAMIVEAGVSST